MTSFTTPTTFTAGQTLTATSLNQQIRDNMLHVTEIQNWSPTVTQSSTVSRTVTFGRYWQAGKRVWANCDLAITGTGSSGVAITLSLPVTATSGQASSALAAIGSGWIIDNSTPTGHVGLVLCRSTTTCSLRLNGQINDVGLAPSFGLANSDRISFSIQYEAA